MKKYVVLLSAFAASCATIGVAHRISNSPPEEAATRKRVTAMLQSAKNRQDAKLIVDFAADDNKKEIEGDLKKEQKRTSDLVCERECLEAQECEALGDLEKFRPTPLTDNFDPNNPATKENLPCDSEKIRPYVEGRSTTLCFNGLLLQETWKAWCRSSYGTQGRIHRELDQIEYIKAHPKFEMVKKLAGEKDPATAPSPAPTTSQPSDTSQ